MTFTDYQAAHIDTLKRLTAATEAIATALTQIANRTDDHAYVTALDDLTYPEPG